MKQQTLISFYIRKPARLIFLLAALKRLISESGIGKKFIPYEFDQIHATLIGLESIEENGEVFNQNLCNSDKPKAAIRLENFISTLEAALPQIIRFGGFSEEYSEFLSRDEAPYNRSFFIDVEKNRAVLIGWPIEDGDFSGKSLLNLREAICENCKIMHKYPDDNDFYLVLGEFEGGSKSFNPKEIKKTQKRIRDFLSQNPVEIEVSKRSLLIADYTDVRLPLKTTETFTLEEYAGETPE